jgi:hypothetical protein
MEMQGTRDDLTLARLEIILAMLEEDKKLKTMLKTLMALYF